MTQEKSPHDIGRKAKAIKKNSRSDRGVKKILGIDSIALMIGFVVSSCFGLDGGALSGNGNIVTRPYLIIPAQKKNK